MLAAVQRTLRAALPALLVLAAVAAAGPAPDTSGQTAGPGVGSRPVPVAPAQAPWLVSPADLTEVGLADAETTDDGRDTVAGARMAPLARHRAVPSTITSGSDPAALRRGRVRTSPTRAPPVLS